MPLESVTAVSYALRTKKNKHFLHLDCHLAVLTFWTSTSIVVVQQVSQVIWQFQHMA